MHVTPKIMSLRNFFFPAFAAVLLLSCSQQPQATADQTAVGGIDRTVKEVSITDGTPVTMADLSIEGMSCEKMCGGSIKKALATLPGVTLTEIKFNEGDVRDHAIVTYDESKVNDAQMIEAIHNLHDGQYKVLAVEITKQVQGVNTIHGSKAGNAEEKGIRVYAPAISLLPSLFALLTQIMRL